MRKRKKEKKEEKNTSSIQASKREGNVYFASVKQISNPDANDASNITCCVNAKLGICVCQFLIRKMNTNFHK